MAARRSRERRSSQRSRLRSHDGEEPPSELAPIRVNVIAAGFVDTAGSAAALGDRLGARRDQLETTLPIRRVIGPADVAALAVHLMTNTAVTGATFEIDGGQQLVER